MIALIGLLGGCDADRSQVLNNQRDSRVAWVTDRPQSLRWEAIKRAVADKAPSYSFLEMLPTATTGNRADGSASPSVAEQLSQAKAAGARFVVLWQSGDPVPMEAITAAEQGGVTVVTVEREITRDRASNHVDVRLPAAAEQLGRDLPKYAAGRQAFILLHYRNRDPEAKTRYERFRAGLITQSEMVLVGESDATGQDPVVVLSQLLDRYPHTTLVVTLESDVWLLPEADAIREDVCYITLDAPPALWPDLKKGRALALIGPNDGEIGTTTLSLVADLATTAERPLANRSVDCQIVSKASLADFAAAYARSVGVPLNKLLP